MTQNYDIVVVGAGLIGCAFALDVANKTDLRVALIERSKPLPEINTMQDKNTNQRVVALGLPAIDLLTSVGVFESLSAFHAHPYDSMRVWDEGSNGELEFNAQEEGQTKLGVMVDSIACTSLLQHKALECADRGTLSCYFDTAVKSLDLNAREAEVTCEDMVIKTSLVVGADGANSWVRSQGKIFTNTMAYGQQGIVAKIKTSGNHNNCAWQRFLHSGPVAALPVYDNYSSIVWSADLELANELMALSDQDFCSKLAEAFDWRLGNVIEVSQRRSFPLVSQKAENYFAPSLALIGDAAHSIHPLAGQGANLGFKDAICLSELICGASCSQINHLALLAKYEQRRKRDNEQTDWLMSVINRAYKTDAVTIASLRGLGMNWLNRSDKIKALLIRQAMAG